VPAELNVVDVGREALLEERDKFVLGSPEAALAAVRLRPYGQVNERQSELSPAGEHKFYGAPVYERGHEAAVDKPANRRRHPGTVEGHELVDAHFSPFAIANSR
jgi:hypothetical protein